MNILFTLLLVTGLSLAGSAQASLVDFGTYTQDTDSGLEWLDLTETDGLSYKRVKKMIKDSGSLSGWRYASRDEVRDLYSSAGIGLGNQMGKKYFNEMNALTDLLGDTVRGRTYGFSGLTAESFLLKNNRILFWAATKRFFWKEYSWSNTNGFIQFDTSSSLNVGSFLVRQTTVSAVPVPAAVWLFGSALLGLVGIKRTKS